MESNDNSQADFIKYQCPNCGQIIFQPSQETCLPEICDFCKDMTTWRMVSDQASNNIVSRTERLNAKNSDS
ncbi:hypothetical protein MASR2M15_10230 [Anaerolineales bacterium]